MIKYFASYITIALVMLALDVLWLGFIAKPLYQQGIGHLMAAQPNLIVATVFYLVYAAGLMMFVILPLENANSLIKVVTTAAAFGFFAYATYDLTNWATLKEWPASVAIADLIWGSFASTSASIAGYYVLRALQVR